MNEFYRRVQYANQHFGVGGQGWTTDMGRVYIQKGQPDEVVRSPSTSTEIRRRSGTTTGTTRPSSSSTRTDLDATSWIRRAPDEG